MTGGEEVEPDHLGIEREFLERKGAGDHPDVALHHRAPSGALDADTIG